MRTIQGTTGKYFRVLVTDTQPSFGNSTVSYTATLESPAGMDFDLFVYPGDGSGPNCFATPLQGGGSPESVSGDWEDANLSDDERWITFEVRHVSGSDCSAAAKWTLTVEGHTGP